MDEHRQKLDTQIAAARAGADIGWAELRRYHLLIEKVADGKVPMSCLEPSLLQSMLRLIACELQCSTLSALALEDDYSNRSEL